MQDEIEIEVSEEDCLEGCRGTEHYCVVATAVARAFPEANHHEVNVDTIRFSLKEDGVIKRFVYRTPDEVREYIRSFDAGEDAKPMKFKLSEPQISEKTPRPLGAARTPSFKAQGSPKKRRTRVFGEKSFQSI